MRIVRLETFCNSFVGFVRLTTEDGDIGWGQLSTCKYLEFSIEGAEYYPWQVGLFVEDPYTIRDGRATVTGQPGWGVEICPTWLARSTHQCSETRA